MTGRPHAFSQHVSWPFPLNRSTLPRVGTDLDPALANELRGSHAGHRRANAKKATFLTAVENGATIKEAIALVQMSAANYKYWRQSDPEFRRKLDYARVRENFAKDGGWKGDFATFRDTYFKLQYPTPSFHIDMIRRLEQAPAMSITLMLVPPNHGKLLELDTPLPTPDGWTTMGEVQVGDTLFDERGEPCRVRFVSDVQHVDGMRVQFADGSTINACTDHLWFTRTRKPQYGQSVKTTAEIAATVQAHGRPNHAVPVQDGLRLTDVELPLDPYFFGVWLGDGTTRAGAITAGDQDAPALLNQWSLAGWTPNRITRGVSGAPTYHFLGLRSVLNTMGVFGNKHIPATYLRSSEKQRLALLQGLMDSDGHCAPTGQCEFTTIKSDLADDVKELILSLGFKVRHYGGRATLNGRDYGPKYRLSFFPRPEQPVFRLGRKAERQRPSGHDRHRWQQIAAVEPIGHIFGRCVQVDSPSKLYLAGKQMVPTHNTTLIEDWINYKLAIDPNHRITVVSKGQGQARKMLGRVQRRMTDATAFGQYVARFGPFYEIGQEKEGKPWTRDYFTVKKADHDERDYSLQTLGWTGQVYGSRVDTLILDDIQTHDNLTSVEGMMDKFRLEFLSRPGDEGKVVIVGTRIEVGDFYERLIDHDIVTSGQLVVMPAVDYEGHALWPERWSEDKLEIVRKNVGEKAWWCGYQQKPSLAGTATFSEQMVEDSKDPMRMVGRGPNNAMRHGLPVVLSLDPALGGGNALVCTAYDDANMFILDAQKDVGLARTEDILERVEQFAMRYSPNDLVIETVAFQRGLARDDRMEALKRKYGFQVHEHLTNKNKLDPIMGVGSMAGTFLRREISIPWADEIAKTRMEPLCAELRAWRPSIPARILVQDYTMALWFGWLFIQSRRRFLGNKSSDWTRARLPYQPTAFSLAGYG